MRSVMCFIAFILCSSVAHADLRREATIPINFDTSTPIGGVVIASFQWIDIPADRIRAMSLDVLVSQDGDADLAGLWDWDADAPLYLVTLEGQGWMHSSASVPPPFDRWHINGQGFVHPQFAYLAQPESPPTTYLQRAELRVIYVPWCVADYDNGSGAGFPDRGVTIDDLLFYLPLFATGNTNADLDDGTATGTQDGGITIDDLLYFLTHFYEGC